MSKTEDNHFDEKNTVFEPFKLINAGGQPNFDMDKLVHELPKNGDPFLSEALNAELEQASNQDDTSEANCSANSSFYSVDENVGTSEKTICNQEDVVAKPDAANNGSNAGADVSDAWGISSKFNRRDNAGKILNEGDMFKRNNFRHIGVMPTHKDAENYNMSHERRGVALIFNHMEFDEHLGLRPRNGTNADLENLRKTMKTLDFDVRVYNDFHYKEIIRALDYCADEDHNDADCLFVAVLSHGEHQKLYSKDREYNPEKLWKPFTADKCSSLAGKPKMFFIQACQGDQLDCGVKLRNVTQTDAIGGNSGIMYKIPNHADFLIAYSTIPGFYSWRNTTAGSWFIQALCHVLQTRDEEEDLQTLLTRVNRKVAFDFQSNTPGDRSMHEKKQIPCITSMLTRKVCFTRKIMEA